MFTEIRMWRGGTKVAESLEGLKFHRVIDNKRLGHAFGLKMP